AAEAADQLALLPCRAWSLLAAQTGQLSAYQAAAAAGPRIAAVRAALGCALARTGRFAEAADHLAVAVESDPFDGTAAAALVAALTDANRPDHAQPLRSDCRRLAKAAPGLVTDPYPRPHPPAPPPPG